MPRKLSQDTKVYKTISMPLSFVERILDESNIARTNFSDTVVIVGKIGLSVRAENRERAEREERERAEQYLHTTPEE